MPRFVPTCIIGCLMAKTKTHKSQHYVSKCYLSAWEDPNAPEHMDPYVWVFDRDARAGQPKAPKNVFEETPSAAQGR